MNNKEVMAFVDEHVMHTYGRFPIAIEKGKGATMYDFDGKKYIDFAAGIGVSSLGQADEDWVDAITQQAKTLGHASNLFYTKPMADAAQMLCDITGMDKVFFANSGAEANEGAIKLARKYSFDKYGEGRAKIITLINSFHGRTITTLRATGQDVFHQYFFPFTDGFCHVPSGDKEALLEAITDDVCAVMIELIQGEGGVMPVDKEYANFVQDICREKDLLFIVDEVQTGVGRTGAFYAFMKYGLSPDVVTSAKGIAGGLPMGAILAKNTCSGVLGAGTHATTFGANPVCCAAAKVAIGKISDKKFLEEVEKKGEYIREKIIAFGSKKVRGVRGMGLMIGVIVPEGEHKKLARKMIDNGLLCITAGKDAIRLLPPLVITYEEIDEGLKIMKNTLDAED